MNATSRGEIVGRGSRIERHDEVERGAAADFELARRVPSDSPIPPGRAPQDAFTATSA